MTYVRARRLGVMVIPYQAPPAVTQIAPAPSGAIQYRVPTSYIVATPPVTAPGVPAATPPSIQVVTPVPPGQPNTNFIPITAATAAALAPLSPVAAATGETSTAPLPGAASGSGDGGSPVGGSLSWGWIALGAGVLAVAVVVSRR